MVRIVLTALMATLVSLDRRPTPILDMRIRTQQIPLRATSIVGAHVALRRRGVFDSTTRNWRYGVLKWRLSEGEREGLKPQVFLDIQVIIPKLINSKATPDLLRFTSHIRKHERKHLDLTKVEFDKLMWGYVGKFSAAMQIFKANQRFDTTSQNGRLDLLRKF